MWHRRNLLLLTFLALIYTSYGCQMENVNWNVDEYTVILDTHTGVFYTRNTIDVAEVISITYVTELHGGPYVHASVDDSVFTLSTTEAFSEYEEYETSQIMYFGINFRCTDGSTPVLMVYVTITDTNNHSPEFRPTDVYEFTVAPPLPPGFRITGCGYEIIARDIDLTTQRVDFTIEENPLFEIAYDPSLENVTKEFRATLTTKTFIRNITETRVLTIYATDYDTTNDSRRTTSATLIINGATEFQLPDEPIFSQAFYSVHYTATHNIVMQEPISLQQGDYENVQFSLEGDNEDNFDLYIDGNEVSLIVLTPLSDEALRAGDFVLVVRAEMEYTSGATTTVFVQLPEVINLEFEQPIYEGLIVDNILHNLSPLVLSQGYENDFSVTIISDHSSFFSYTIQENVITIAMEPLDENIIMENSFINLQVIASSGDITATAILILDIVKDDRITPVFESAIYTGTYDRVLGLTLEQIILGQGYDDTTVTFSLEGDHRNYFEITNDGPVITMTSTVIPPEIWTEKSMVFFVRANKPRTVGANAVVVISFPSVRAMSFDASTYVGILQDQVIVHDPIILNVGFDLDVNFELISDYPDNFRISTDDNRVNLHVESLTEDIISENNFLIFTIKATGVHTETATTTVLIEIIKQDDTTPVFSQSIYNGNYLGGIVEFESIKLSQGYDSSVDFRLDGAHSEYFELNHTDENVMLSLVAPIPDELIFNEKVLLFNVIAEKPLTVGATAAISINFPRELTEPTVMRFLENTYRGFLEDDSLAIESISLETGYADNTEFILTSDFITFFKMDTDGNSVTLTMSQALPPEIIENYEFIVLELEAQRERAISVSTSIIITIVKQDNVIPIFDEAFYRGVYTRERELHFEQEISLAQGFDSTVTFGIQGEFAPYFTISHDEGSVAIGLNDTMPLPEDILLSNNQLLFAVIVYKPGTINGQTAISIDLPKECTNDVVLGFGRIAYQGSIEDNVATMEEIILEGYTEAVLFQLHGSLSEHFSFVNDGPVGRIVLITAIPNESIPNDRIILLELRASLDDTQPASASLVFSVVQDDNRIPDQLIFGEPYYTGHYIEEDGLVFDNVISLYHGYDENVQFMLEGVHSQWFEPEIVGENSVVLRLTAPIPPSTIINNHQLVFLVRAHKFGSLSGNATMVISLLDEYTNDMVLGFGRIAYQGSIEDNVATMEEIILEGYTEAVLFQLHGSLSEHFSFVNDGPVGRIALITAIPNESIPNDRIILLELRASLDDTQPASASLIFSVVQDDNRIPDQLIFGEPYYTGHYIEEDGLIFDNVISLYHGYDENVQFMLEGVHSQWFEPEIVGENSVVLRLTTPIPPSTIINNHQLVFLVRAHKFGSLSGNATMVISLLDEYTNDMVLGFGRIAYQGSIEDNVATMEEIILEGYTEAVLFQLHGSLSEHFSYVNDGPVGRIALITAIPNESIPNDRIILLELRASLDDTQPASASLIFSVVQDDNRIPDQLIFGEPYYTGHYIEEDGLVFDNVISLYHGYDENVQFMLEGVHSQWFEPEIVGENSVVLRLTTPIPPSTIINNHQLVFLVRAHKFGSLSGNATMVISLLDEYTNDMVLGFGRIAYQGSIEDNVATMEEIILEGYTEAVLFQLHGSLSEHFSYVNDGPVGRIALITAIPNESIPNDRIILLELRASLDDTQPASASLIFSVVQDDNRIPDQLIFGEPYYTGHYIEEDGLVFDNVISLYHGYDENVQFMLEGVHSQWFEPEIVGENSVVLRLTTPIPPSTIINNHQLVFLVRAHKLGSLSGNATMVISLLDEYTNDMVLGFGRIAYQGSIEDNVATMEEIILEGYTEAVLFQLHGSLSEYFSFVNDGPVGRIVLITAIPNESIPNDRIILLELRASLDDTQPASASLVFSVVQDDNRIPDQLIFGEPYYTGHYIEEDGLVFDNVISLYHGYDENVQFMLEGVHSQWFEPEIVGENSVVLRLTTPIPPSTIINNHQLVFLVRAHKFGSLSGNATMVISLLDEYTNDMVLGFGRIAYQGSIEDNVATMEEIILEGYTKAVLFQLHGSLSEHFSFVNDGPVGRIALITAIPNESIPNDRIILLELRASLDDTQPASASLVFSVVQDDNRIPDQLIFGEPYYTGHYIEEDGLVFDNVISLYHGYDENVQFMLEGVHSQWFEPEIVGENSVVLRLTTPIPPSTIINNHQLVFLVRAHKFGSLSGNATMVISLLDEYTNDMVLGFGRIAYQGLIEDNVATMEEIILEGYTEAVLFQLHGGLSEHFSFVNDGPVGRIALITAIPNESIPNDRIILLELRASLDDTQPASASLIFSVVQDDNRIPDQLIFGEPYYTGHYIEEDGLVFDNVISLYHGYDENVQFMLEGVHSQWFEPEIVGENSVVLRLTTPIPPSTIINNHQLVFLVRAHKFGSLSGNATMVISLLDEYTNDMGLGFGRIAYQGSIEDNVATMEEIILEGYTEAVLFQLHGSLSEHFSFVNDGPVGRIALITAIPNESIPNDRIILLELRASLDDTQPASASLVFSVVQDDNRIPDQLIFGEPYYTGHYIEEDGLVFDNVISLYHGYDENVQFMLEGVHSQWFEPEIVGENSVVLRLTTPIPPSTIINNHQLVFLVRAHKFGSLSGNATMVISLLDEYTNDMVLGFGRIAYQGLIEDNVATMEEIILEGYTEAVLFQLHGGLSEYFSFVNDGPVGRIALITAIPNESIPNDRIILLELRASLDDTQPASASLIFSVVQDDNRIPDQLIFGEPYYTGHYIEEDGLVFDNVISLYHGYDENVQFMLEGVHSQWFEPEIVGENSVVLRLTTPIPPSTIINNHQLVFLVRAHKFGSLSGNATMVISLLDEYTNDMVLGFGRIAYQGSIEDNVATMEEIILEGYTEAVLFQLHGSLSEHFSFVNDGPVGRIALITAIPNESIPNDRIILLELRASLDDTQPASASLIFSVVQDDNRVPDQLIFGEPYYTGHYIEEDGLVFDNVISLYHGYDENVQFMLEGVHSQWFEPEIVGENSVVLRLTTPIPPSTIINNHQLAFLVRAHKLGSLSGNATMVISLLDEYTNDMVLGFGRIAYQGSIEDNVATMEEIILEGYTEAVLFQLHGSLSEHFSYVNDGPVGRIALITAIPNESIPNDRIILLELRASLDDTQPASASLIFSVVQDDNRIPDQLIFGEPYYTGHYIEEDGLVFDNVISLYHGYDENVQFMLEGVHSQWFEPEIVGENSVVLRLTTPIPPSTIINNHQLVFLVRAHKLGSSSGNATMVISLLDEYTNDMVLGFGRIAYQGSIEDNVATMEEIILEGYTEAVLFQLHGSLSEHFSFVNDGPVGRIALITAIPNESIPNDRIILLELRASLDDTQPASASLVFSVVQDDNRIPDQLIFGEPYYTGHYIEEDGLVFDNDISLYHGYDENVQFMLEGVHSQWFEPEIVGENSVVLRLTTPIPPSTIINNHQLVFLVRAHKLGSLSGNATMVISLLDEYTNDMVLGFGRIAYQGSIEDNVATMEEIILEGYTEAVLFQLHGSLSEHFSFVNDGPVGRIALITAIPNESIPNDRIILLELRASLDDTQPASASLVFSVVQDDNRIPDQLIFGEPYYTGHYIEEDGLVFDNVISLYHGYDENVQFMLEGVHSQWFEPEIVGENSVVLRLTTPIPPSTIINNHQLVFLVRAHKFGSLSGNATMVISLLDEYTNYMVLGFGRIAYQGSIEDNVATMEEIILEGYTEAVLFQLHGSLSEHFSFVNDGPVGRIALITAIPNESIPNDRIILLELRASLDDTQPASASLVFSVVQDDNRIPDQLIFGEPYYTGHYIEEDGLVFDNVISLYHGYDENVQFMLEGVHSQWFEPEIVGENSVVLRLTTPIPPSTIINNHQLVFLVRAHKLGSLSGNATMVISLLDGSDVSFEKLLYEGKVSGGQVQHEPINLLGYNATAVELYGEYAELFVATTTEGAVEIRGVGSVILSEEYLYVPLELRAGSSRAVLLLDIDHTESPEPPTVTFSSPSYELRLNVDQTGVVGRVGATADNGERITYSLIVSDEHLQNRLWIDREGQLGLFAPANSGVHSFQVVATTVFSQSNAIAPVYLTVDAITVCDNDDLVLPPLIILDRDEEEPHANLVTLPPTQSEECRFILTSRWPLEQNWLYVDDTGLHTRAIDREHESIAFMHLSQVQVALILECDSDNLATRAKRSLTTEARQDWLGPYDYGSNKWILTDTIHYNSRRSLVNLIVNDINDNAPVFVGKQNEPIVVGYPVPALEEIVLPRALAELKATDADVGENARLMYWSSEDVLAVSPSTGLVHVRHNTRLENNSRLTVSATDRNGEGLTGSIDLLVRLLNSSHIVVIRVNAILDDEDRILVDLSAAVGYEIKLLSSAVISDELELDSNEVHSRKERDLSNNVEASLQLFIYGLDQQQPVLVEKLMEDITNNVGAVSVVSSLSLADYLDGLEICTLPGRDVGLLVATIVLSVLLFIVIVAAAVWLFLRWRKKMNYEKFSDAQSLSSSRESPVVSSPEKSSMPRLNIEELKRSERRLQERLGAPIPEVLVRPSTSAMEAPVESKINIPVEEPQVPTVIQSIDRLKDADESTDDDEFGERKPARKKSVVTFNENVEKIIHVEDAPDDDSVADYGVYKL